MSAVLTVPPPTLDYDALAPGVAAAERPLTVRLGPVLREAQPLSPEQLTGFVLLTSRRLGPASPAELWDPVAAAWVPEGSVFSAGEPLVFREGQPLPWEGLVVAGGQRDASGQRTFAAAVGGFPQYRFRGRFEIDDGVTYEEVVSAESQAVAFGSVTDRNRMVLGPAEGERPDTATQARLQLKDAALQLVGGLVIRRGGGSAEVTVSNSAGASVVLLPDGAIELRPAAGRGVTVAGDLETEHLTYLPAGGGSKKTAV